MTSLPPPESAPPQHPPFSEANACRQWLKTLPLTNVPLAHTTLTARLELLNRAAIAPLERLRISELLREPVAFLQQEQAKKYLGKPVPLNDVQHNAWKSVVALWAAIGSAYRLSLQAGLEGEPDAAAHLALITHRCLRYTGQQMMEHYRAYREIGQELWAQAHRLYALAEQRDYATHTVKDSLNRETGAATCAAAYAQILLTDLADPYRLTARQLGLLERWLDKWAVRASVVAAPPEDGSLSPVGVDLAGAAGPVSVRDGQALADPRYLDMERIAATFRKRIKRLGKGEDPAALGLGEDCARPDCEALLATLYRRWREPAPKHRNFARRPGTNKAQAALGVAAIHFFISGEKIFKQPGEKETLGKREIEDLQFFGRIREQTEKLHLSQLGFALEAWHIQDESALGFHLARLDAEGVRIAQKQLIAVRPADSSTYALGVIKWLAIPPNDGPHIGVRVLPGAPLAIAARPAPAADAENKYTQAFLLPDMPVLRETASLVLPPGWFSPGRLVEIRSGEARTVRLIGLIERGNDFERVGFVGV